MRARVLALAVSMVNASHGPALAAGSIEERGAAQFNDWLADDAIRFAFGSGGGGAAAFVFKGGARQGEDGRIDNFGLSAG